MAFQPDKPIGNSAYGPFFIRVTIGAYFLLAGLAKLDDVGGFVEKVRSFGILPDQLATLYGILLPYTEIVVGVLLLVGFWTILGAIVSSLLLISFIRAFGVFGVVGPIFNKDIVFLAGTISLLYTGPGAFSIDKFRHSGS